MSPGPSQKFQFKLSKQYVMWDDAGSFAIIQQNSLELKVTQSSVISYINIRTIYWSSVCNQLANAHPEFKQRKNATHYVKLGKKRRESSKRNYYIISPRVIIKAIIIIQNSTRVKISPKKLLKFFRYVEFFCFSCFPFLPSFQETWK